MSILSRITSGASTLAKNIHVTQSGVLLGRYSSGAGKAQEITLGSGVTVTGGELTVAPAWSDITGKPTEFTPAAHTHTFSSLTSKPTTLAGYGITDAAASSHTHALSSLTQSGAFSKQVVMWSGGNWVPSAVSYLDLTDVPTAVPLTASKVVANAAARLALNLADAEGFAVVEADTGKSYMLVEGGNPATSGDWTQIGDRDIQWADVGGKPTIPTVDNTTVNTAIAEDPAASLAALELDDATSLAKSGKPSRLFQTMKRLTDNRGASKPLVLSTLVVGDSWALSVEDYIRGTMGQAGYLTGPVSASVTNATLTTGKTEYAKTPWGQSVVMDASGEYATWGVYSGGIASAGRFQASRYLTVHYEAISGGGEFKVQYEDRTGSWVDVATISSDNSGASTYTVWESSALAGVESPRVRTVWVSGSSKIYAAGAAANSANNPGAGTNRAGGIFCDVSYGGSAAVDWDATPQSAWTALLGWLKTDIVFLRERRESDLATWESAIDSLVTKIRTARATTDVVFIGSHPTTEESGAANDRVTDEFLKSYTADNGHLFVDMRSFFPTTYAASSDIGLQELDGIHASVHGKALSKSVIWQHLAPIRNFISEADPTTKNGPWFTPSGARRQWLIQQDGNTEDAYLGTEHLHRGTTSTNNGVLIVFNKRDTSQVSEGFQWTYGGQPFWQMDSSNRHLVSSTTSTLARTLGGTMEFMSGQTTRHALRVSGVSGQASPILEVRTGASHNASGTLVAGYSKEGVPWFPSYTTTQRDALTGVTAGSMILNATTGKLNFYTGSSWEAVTSSP